MSHIAHINELLAQHVNESCVYAGGIYGVFCNDMAHMRISHSTHVNESRHTCEWVIAQPANASCLFVGGIYGICCHDTSRMGMSHGTRVNESRHTCERVMSACRWDIWHVLPRHVTYVLPRLELSTSTCHTYE